MNDGQTDNHSETASFKFKCNLKYGAKWGRPHIAPDRYKPLLTRLINFLDPMILFYSNN